MKYSIVYNEAMETQRITAGISYTLRRNRNQRNLRIRIDSSGAVIVSCPFYATDTEIEDFVSRSASWIHSHVEKVADHSYTTSDFVPYLGEKKTLLVIEGKKARYDIIDDKIIVTARNQNIEAVKKQIKALYIKTVEDILIERVPYWCSQVGVDVPAFGVNRAKGKWGVCYPLEKRLYLSYMCATLPRYLIDMTVLHEVCHLRYSGHGKRFWALMRKHMPDLDERKAGLSELVKSGWSMNIV